MFFIKSPAVGDNLYPPTEDERQALMDAVRYVLENGVDAEVRDENDVVRWYAKADEPSEAVQPVVVTAWGTSA